MVTHKTLVERFGDSPAIKLAKRIQKPVVSLNNVDGEWVLTWTTGGNETITIRDVKGLKIEPLYEEKLSHVGRGPKQIRSFKSEGSTLFDPDKCPCCYDGLSFSDFSEIKVELANAADFYTEWDVIIAGQTEFIYRK